MSSTLAKAEVALKKVYPDYPKFFRYLAVGAISTTINLLVYYLIISNTSVEYLYANIVSFHAGMVFSYILNRKFTFRSVYDKVHVQLASFALVAYTQLIVVEAVLILVVELVFRNDADSYAMLANMIAIAVGFAYAFNMNSKLTFKRSR